LLTKGRPPTDSVSTGSNLVGPDVRSYGTHCSSSEGQHFGGNDQEETWRVFLYWFQPFTRPTFRQVAQQRVRREDVR
jgi:hypothetical protein